MVIKAETPTTNLMKAMLSSERYTKLGDASMKTVVTAK
jgi:hypothetical protein